MKRNVQAALLSIALAAATALPARAGDGWLRYTEPRTGAVAGVPLAVFEPEPFANDLGVVFEDPSGEIQMEVFGWENPDGSSLQAFARDIRRETANEKEFTYERVGKTFFVQSGFLQGATRPTVFYERTERSRDNRRMVTMRLIYPVARRAAIDPWIREIGNRLIRPR